MGFIGEGSGGFGFPNDNANNRDGLLPLVLLLGPFTDGVLSLGVTGSLYADLGVPLNQFLGKDPVGLRREPLGAIFGLGTNLGGGDFGEAIEGGITLGSCAEALVAVATANTMPTNDRASRLNDIGNSDTKKVNINFTTQLPGAGYEPFAVDQLKAANLFPLAGMNRD